MIDKIRAFSRSARAVCRALFWFGVVVGIASLLVELLIALFVRNPTPGNADGGVYDHLMSPLTPLPLKLWWLVTMYVWIGLCLAAVRQLQRLFGNMAAGAIHTPENVRRVRYVGLLWLLSAALDIVFPLMLAAANRLFDMPASAGLADVLPSFDDSLTSFVAAGLVLLASWIMDVGLYEKQHADALRRDADLVI